MSERIELSLRDDGRVDIVAPRDADFCRDALKDGRTVIVHAPDDGFVPSWVTKAKVVLEMDHVTGRVDVAAPLPNRALCLQMVDAATQTIEKYINGLESKPIPTCL